MASPRFHDHLDASILVVAECFAEIGDGATANVALAAMLVRSSSSILRNENKKNGRIKDG
jgi:hypothetical protein